MHAEQHRLATCQNSVMHIHDTITLSSPADVLSSAARVLMTRIARILFQQRIRKMPCGITTNPPQVSAVAAYDACL